MSFKMKGSPAKMGTIQGTAGHTSALKLHAEASALKALENEKNYSDDEELEGQFEKQEKLEKKEAKRDAKRESGKKVFLGNLKTNINKKKRSKIQKSVDEESYGDAFNAAKDAGRSTFTWRGKSYTTETRSEKNEREKKEYVKNKAGEVKETKTVDEDYETEGTRDTESKPDLVKKSLAGITMKGSPAKHLGRHPHDHPHPEEKETQATPSLEEVEDHGTETKDNISEKEAQRRQDELDAKNKSKKSTGKTKKTKSKKEIKNEEKLNKLYNKRTDLKEEGGDVKGSDKVDRKYRRIQNKINRLHDDPTRHRKNIFTGGKYKKVVKK